MRPHADPLHLELLPRREADGRVLLRAALIDHRGADTEVRFELPAEHAEGLTDTADPFVLALVFTLMERGRPVVVHGRVSPTLLCGLEEFMACWELWRPRRLRSVEIRADEEAEPPTQPEPGLAVTAFSGGLDSCYTAWRHHRGLVERRRRRVTHGVLVEGLEKRLPPGPRADAVRAAAEQLLRSLDIVPVAVTTNFRQLHPAHGAYNAWIATVTACMILLQGRLDCGLIPSGFDYRSLVVPHPTTPATDPLLSTGAFEVVHDGAEVVRAEKAAALHEWEVARRHMRVCFHGGVDALNCGRCEKCVRTILCFRVMGLGPPPCFPGDVSLAQVRGLSLATVSAVRSALDLVRTAEERGQGGEDWVRAVRAALAHERRKQVLRGWRDRLTGTRPSTPGPAGGSAAEPGARPTEETP